MSESAELETAKNSTIEEQGKEQEPAKKLNVKTKTVKTKTKAPVTKKEKPVGNEQLKKGIVSLVDLISPSSIDTRNWQYIEADGMYIATVLITGYPYERVAGWLGDIISFDEGIELNMYYEPLDKAKLVKELTYTIGVTSVNRRNVGENQSDVDVIDAAIGHARYMRAQMQLESEDPYYLYLLISVYGNTKEQLEERLTAIEAKLGAMDIMSRRADFRHEDGFIACLPLHQITADLKKTTARNALTSGLASTYPFVSSEFCDNDGIFFGLNEHNRSLVIVDIFNTKLYKNANMCILGTSGAGKTFLIQLLAMRNRIQGVSIMIIAPLKGHEFKRSCIAIGGQFLRIAPGSDDCINIMEIRNSTLDEDLEEERDGSKKEMSLVLAKIQKLHVFFSLVFVDMTVEEKQFLDDKLVECYENAGMTFDNDSLYEDDPTGLVPLEERKFKKMPVLGDLYQLLEDDPDTERLALILKRLVTGSLKSFNQQTNVDLSNKYTVADVSELKEDLLPIGMYIVTDFFWDKIKEDRTQKKIVVVDEAWNLIGSTGNRQTAGFILEIFKIIRGYGGSAIAATQDVNDFLALEGGKYGKGIINNAKLKILLQIEEEDAESLRRILKLSQEEMAKVTSFKRGHALFYAGANHLAIEFVASQEEKDMITTDRSELAELKRRKEEEKNGLGKHEEEMDLGLDEEEDNFNFEDFNFEDLNIDLGLEEEKKE